MWIIIKNIYFNILYNIFYKTLSKKFITLNFHYQIFKDRVLITVFKSFFVLNWIFRKGELYLFFNNIENNALHILFINIQKNNFEKTYIIPLFFDFLHVFIFFAAFFNKNFDKSLEKWSVFVIRFNSTIHELIYKNY